VERTAFARAWNYLNYSPAAKWLAIAAPPAPPYCTSSRPLLALFTDLIVTSGRIPSFHELSANEATAFAASAWSRAAMRARSESVNAMAPIHHARRTSRGC